MKKKYEELVEINAYVSDDSQLLSPYAEIDNPVVSSEFAEFLTTSAKAFHPKSKLRINMISDCIDEEEKSVYTAAVHNYFSLQLEDNERERRLKTVVSLCFTLIGILALAFMLVLEYRGVGAVWTECVDIFAWVFLWEAVDQYFIERKSLTVKNLRIRRFIECEIYFKDLSDV